MRAAMVVGLLAGILVGLTVSPDGQPDAALTTGEPAPLEIEPELASLLGRARSGAVDDELVVGDAPLLGGPLEAWHCAGTVQTPDGDPVPGARVSIAWRGKPQTELACDERGRFRTRLDWLAELGPLLQEDGVLSLRASAPAHGPVIPRTRTLSGGTVIPWDWDGYESPATIRRTYPSAEPLWFRLVLTRTPTIRGRVISRSSGAVADAAVSVESIDDEPDSVVGVACTDHEGRFCISVDPRRAYRLQAEHISFGKVERSRIEVMAEAVELTDLELEAAATLSGVLLHERLGPVSHFGLYAVDHARLTGGTTAGFSGRADPPRACFAGLSRYSFTDRQEAHAVTDSAGRFQIPLPQWDGDWLISTEADDVYGCFDFSELRLPAGSQGVRLTVRDHLLRVVLTTRAGERVPSFLLRAMGVRAGEALPRDGPPVQDWRWRPHGPECPPGCFWYRVCHPVSATHEVQMWVPHGSTWSLKACCSQEVRITAPHDQISSLVELRATSDGE